MTGTFHITELNDSLKAGDVWRMNDWSAFPDVVILGFDSNSDAKVARPYAYASSTGTTCPTPLQGMEIYTLPVAHLKAHYKKVGDGRVL